ncbi:MAG TPA: ABC transporter ATP-binding protein [Actinomycetota bacterium]|jgi:branched-chain amino acid transport system ATP-binding protein
MSEQPNALPLLDARGVSKNFGGVQALDRVDLTVGRGEVVGLIGPNGAGKTTMFNVICGLAPTAGRVHFRGWDITGLPPHQICRRGIARTFQLTRPFIELSVQDNVAAAALFGRDAGRPRSLAEAREVADLALAWVKLDGRGTLLARDLSFSERRRLELARALATGPELLCLDEVMAGLTVEEADDVVEILGRLRQELMLSLLVIEHVMKVVMAVCDRIVVLNHGSKLAEGRPGEVAGHPGVIEAYLGVDGA